MNPSHDSSKVIKVCHVAVADLWAGAEVHLVTLLPAMAQLPGFEVSAVLFNEGRVARELRNVGIAVTVIPEKGFCAAILLERLVKHFLDHEFHIIHTHKPKDGFLGAIACRVSGTPYLVRTLHGVWEPFRGFHYVKMKAYACIDWTINKYLVDRLIAVASEIYARRIQSYTPEKLVCIHNGIDLDKVKPEKDKWTQRKELGIDQGDVIIGTVGRLSSVKGHACLLKAMQIVLSQKRRVKLLIVGDGPLESQLKDLAIELRIERDVLFVGHQDSPHDFINAMDIFALPSLQEGMPMVLLEALTLSRPVVASSVGGIPAVIKDGASGLLVKSGNVKELAGALDILMKDRAQAERLGQNGRTMVQEKFNARIMADRTAETYRQLVSAG